MSAQNTGPRAGAWMIPYGFTPEDWTRRVLRHALEAIEAGASASLVMNVEGVKDNIRHLLAAAPVAAPADGPVLEALQLAEEIATERLTAARLANEGYPHRCVGEVRDLQTIRAGLAALAAAPAAAPAWQPIETAPTDGSMFLCWVSAERWSSEDGGGSGRSYDTSGVDFAWWRPPHPEGGDGYFVNCSGQMGDQQDITHWLPLPAAPAFEAPATTPTGEPAAWLNPENPRDPIGAEKKRDLETINGMPGRALAAKYTVALYAGQAPAVKPELTPIGWSAVLTATSVTGKHPWAVSRPQSQQSIADACAAQWRKEYSDQFEVASVRVFADLSKPPVQGSQP